MTLAPSTRVPDRQTLAAPTVASAVASVARAHTDHLFGVMGNGNALLIDAFLEQGGRYSSTRHESGAVAAADAFARSTGRAGVCTTTFGAGFTNAVTALADAARGRSPLVLLTGDAPSSGPRAADVDIPQIARSVGAASWTLPRGCEEQAAASAFSYAQRYSIPVVVSLPYDAVASPAEGGSPDPIGDVGAVPHASADLPDDVVSAVFGAERLLILAGRGAVLAGAEPLLRRLAAMRSAMTATTALAHGIFGDHPRHLGIAGGFGSVSAARVMASADVVLVVGAGLNQHTTRQSTLFPHATIVRVDSDVRAHRSESGSGMRITMDAAEFLTRLLARTPSPARTPSWRDSPSDTATLRALARQPSVRRRLHPQDLSEAIARMLPRELSFILDGGNFMAWPLASIAVPSARAFVPAGLAVQSIGLGLPAMIGAAAAAPDRLAVLAAGDGGLLMSISELESAARLVTRGLIVVYNDSAYGAELHQYESEGLDTSVMRFPETDFAALARSVGMTGAVVRSEADLQVLRDWLRAPAPGVLLLDCRIADDVHAPFLRPIALS